MKRFIKRLFILLLFLGFVSGGVYLYFNTDFLRIQHIEFNENEHLDLYDVQKFAKVQFGTPYFEVDEGDAGKRLMTHPYVKFATAQKRFPNTIIFDVTYRKHFFNIRYSDIVLSMDEQLHVLEVLAVENEGFTIEGFAFDSFSAGKAIDVSQLYILENIVNLIRMLSESHVVAEPLIEFEDRNIILTVDEIKVKFGVGENVETKFNAFVNIYESLRADGINSGVIDVSSDGLPVYRPFGE